MRPVPHPGAMARLLEGKVCLVTGASGGIGRGAAIVLARHGASVVVAARRVAEGEETARLAEQAGGKAVFVRCDPSKAAEVEAMVRVALDRFGRLDGAYNNAGALGPIARTHEQTEESFDALVDANLRSTWLCMKHELAAMLPQGQGSIVNGASASAYLPVPGSAIYSATKAGVVGMTKAAALEYAKDGIRVNAICPGITRTPLIEGVIGGREKKEKYLTSYSAMGRMAAPEEIGEAAAWLLSDLSSFVTGIAMPVDAGQVAGERA
jgi:NAD(P)-dependent dehydrogenase (short-subunit alcohol dehydrogenase family)